jgi:hypothetical protein
VDCSGPCHEKAFNFLRLGVEIPLLEAFFTEMQLKKKFIGTLGDLFRNLKPFKKRGDKGWNKSIPRTDI